MKYLHITARVFNTPLFLTLDKAEVIASVVLARARGEKADDPDAEQIEEPPRVVYAAINGGDIALPDTPRIAVVGMEGSLVHKAAGMRAMSGMRSYTDIAEDVEAAANDSSIRGILLRVNSPGGEIAGSFDAADVIHRAAQIKPVWAIAEDSALSAGYLLASQAHRLLITQSGLVGSIGVVMLHHDMSKIEERAGLRVTTLYRGARKADFSPHAPLSKEAREWAEGLLDARYEQFIAAVSRGRDVDTDHLRQTEAGMFSGQDAVSAKLADGIASYRDTIQEFSSDLSKPTGRKFKLAAAASAKAANSAQQKEGITMPDEPQADASRVPPTDPAQLRTQIETEVRTQVRAEVAEIAAICDVARCPHLAAGFIADGKSKADVLATLKKRKVEDSANEVEIISAITTDASADVSPQERYRPQASTKKPEGFSLASMMRQQFGGQKGAA